MAEGGNKPRDKYGPRKCQVCQINFDDIGDYADHLESKEHIKQKMKEKYGAKYLEAKARLSEEKETVNQNDPNSGSEDGEDEVFSCTICKKVCTGAISYKLHLAGKKHLKAVKNANVLEEMQVKEELLENKEDDDLIFPNIYNIYKSSAILCEVCNKSCSGALSFKQHQDSEGHKKKLVLQKLKGHLSEKELKTEQSSSDGDEDDQSEFARCEVCSKTFSGPLPYLQHIQSQAHKKQSRHNKQMAKIQDLIVASEDENKFHCKQCDKSFSGPIPFKSHCKSGAHKKIKLKNDLIERLKKDFKDLIISSSDDGQLYSCEICHSVFSGPESAKDHFKSPKHQKAEREKERIEKIKLLKNAKQLSSKSNNADETSLNREEDDRNVHSCETCPTAFFDIKPVEDHFNNPKHEKSKAERGRTEKSKLSKTVDNLESRNGSEISTSSKNYEHNTVLDSDFVVI